MTHQMIEYNSTLNDEEIENCEWLCSKCQILKTSQIFPYGLESNRVINYADSMKSLENLPTFDITSQASNFDSLKQYDIDIDNLNSRYSAHKFQSLTANNSFNVFHTNLGSLESKFDLLINNMKTDLDIICLSETSQKLNL